jgi:predicted PurR-regulated permease PerM
LLVVFVGFAALWFAWNIAEILVLLFISAILAAGFSPLVDLVERWKILGGGRLPRSIAVFVLYLTIFALVSLALAVLVLPATKEVGNLTTRMPESATRIRQWLVGFEKGKPWLPDLPAIFDHLSSQSLHFGRLAPSQATGVAFQVVNWIAGLITVLVLTYYMLLEGSDLKRTFLSVFPPDLEPRIELLLNRIGLKFGGWLRGQLILSAAVATPVSLGLFAIGMPLPFLLGLIAGLGELIPVAGPALSAAVAVFIALPQPAWRLFAVIALYLVVLNVEPHILVPRIMLRTVGLSPLLTVVALLIGVKLGGIIGGVLAVPAAAALQVIVKEGVREIGAQPDLVVVEQARGEGEPEAGGAGAEILVGAHIAKNASTDNGSMVTRELQRQGR